MEPYRPAQLRTLYLPVADYFCKSVLCFLLRFCLKWRASAFTVTTKKSGPLAAPFWRHWITRRVLGCWRAPRERQRSLRLVFELDFLCWAAILSWGVLWPPNVRPGCAYEPCSENISDVESSGLQGPLKILKPLYWHLSWLFMSSLAI